MKTKIPHLILAATALFGTTLTSQAVLTIIDDDFSTSSIHVDSRFRLGDIDSNQWVRRNAIWSISGGQLTNPALVATDEEVTHRMDSVNTTAILKTITVSFDYSVGAGTTLWYYSHLFTGTATSLAGRFTQTNGNFFQDFGGPFSGPEYRLHDGGVISGSPGNAVVSFVGGVSGISGTYTATFDIRGYGGGFSAADISYVLNSFTSNNNTTGGAITIDNFLMTAAPEPSSTALLGLGLSSLLLRRRRS